MSFEDKVVDKLDKIQEDVTGLRIEQAKQGKDIERNADDLQAHMEQTRLIRKDMEAHKVQPNAHYAPYWTAKRLTAIGSIVATLGGIIIAAFKYGVI